MGGSCRGLTQMGVQRADSSFQTGKSWLPKDWGWRQGNLQSGNSMCKGPGVGRRVSQGRRRGTGEECDEEEA